MTADADGGRPGYRPALALRHLLAGPTVPRRAMGEALASGIGETGRLAVFVLFVAVLGLVDPETRSLGQAAFENASDDEMLRRGLGMLAAGFVAIGVALYLAYWISALVANVVCGGPWTWAGLARMRSVVALSGWFSLLPTVTLKLGALALLPKAMIAADPPSLYSAIEVVLLLPYFVVCLMVAAGVGAARAALAAILVNGGIYLAVALLSLVPPPA